jgi:hypothetical protein
MDQPQEMAFAKTVHCLEVFHAVQTDSRTSGWYWGDVRGKAAVGAATDALLRRDLISSRVGPPPFEITVKGAAFLKTHEHAWEAFLAKTDQPATIEHFARALTAIPEILEVRDAS